MSNSNIHTICNFMEETFTNLFCLLYCGLFAILYASARNQNHLFNDLDKKKALLTELGSILCVFLLEMILSVHRRLAAVLENCWLCISPSELSLQDFFFFFFLFNVSYAHNELYRLAMLWTSGTHFLCRCVEFITRITTTIDQTNYILDEILIFGYVVLMWSYQCYCLDFSSSFSTP